jgi:formylmethanofuran dehydrogenase subunit E
MYNWKIIDDTKLRHVWRCVDCKNESVVEPWWYQNNGTPVCEDCDEDMLYLSTEQKDG